MRSPSRSRWCAVVTESPSLLLQRAATRLEDLATDLPEAPWKVQPDGDVHSTDRKVVIYSEYGDVEVQWAPLAGQWVEAMSPAVAQPLVNILRDAAFNLDAHPEYRNHYLSYIALAEAVLGTTGERQS